MVKVSIIVPIYNVEKYLSKCINSILCQVFKDFEVILIDDGSSDDSGKIVDEYAKKDARIIPIHQDNKGVSAARNAGLLKAKGEYIGFVDPDDWIEPNLFKVLVEQIEKYNCDIACCSWMNNYEQGNEVPFNSCLESSVFNKIEFVKHLYDMPPTVLWSVCAKLFKRIIIKEFFSTKYFMGEDRLFLVTYCMNIKNAVYLNQPLYHVFNRGDSITRKDPGKKVYGLVSERETIEVARSIDKECGMLAERMYLNHCIRYYKREKKYRTVYKSIVIEEFKHYFRKNIIQILENHTMFWKFKVLLIYYFLLLGTH